MKGAFAEENVFVQGRIKSNFLRLEREDLFSINCNCHMFTNFRNENTREARLQNRLSFVGILCFERNKRFAPVDGLR